MKKYQARGVARLELWGWGTVGGALVWGVVVVGGGGARVVAACEMPRPCVKER